MIKFIQGNIQHLNDCIEALQDSKLGEVYFSSWKKAKDSITEGIHKKEIIVALDPQNNYLGFLWYIPNGSFHSFPYLHIIAIKKLYRNQGYGKLLISHFEEEILDNKGKIFLVVADFNPNAKRLYEKLGYIQVGKIKNLYKEGVSEHLMMKVLT